MLDNNDPRIALRTARLWQSDLACAVDFEGDEGECAKALGIAKAKLRHLLKTHPGATSLKFQREDGVEIEIYTRPNRIRIKAGGLVAVIANAADIRISQIDEDDSWLYKKATTTPLEKTGYYSMGHYWYSADKRKAVSWVSLPLSARNTQTSVAKRVFVRGQTYFDFGAIAHDTHLLSACLMNASHAKTILNNRTGIDGLLVWLALGRYTNSSYGSAEHTLTVQAFWLDQQFGLLRKVEPVVTFAPPNDPGASNIKLIDVCFSRQADSLFVSYGRSYITTAQQKIDRYTLSLSQSATLTATRDELVTFDNGGETYSSNVAQNHFEYIVVGDMTADHYCFIYVDQQYTITVTAAENNMAGTFDRTDHLAIKLGKIELATNTVTLDVKTLYENTLTGSSSGAVGSELSFAGASGAVSSQNLIVHFGFYDADSDIALFHITRSSSQVSYDGPGDTLTDTFSQDAVTVYRHINNQNQSIGQIMPAFSRQATWQCGSLFFHGTGYPGNTDYHPHFSVLNKNETFTGSVNFFNFKAGFETVVFVKTIPRLFEYYEKGYASDNDWMFLSGTGFGNTFLKYSKGCNGKVLVYRYGVIVQRIPDEGGLTFNPDDLAFQFTDYGQYSLGKTMQPVPVNVTFTNVSVTT